MEVRKQGAILVKPEKPSSSKKLLVFELPYSKNDFFFHSVACMLQLSSSSSCFLRLLTSSLSSSLHVLSAGISLKIVPS